MTEATNRVELYWAFIDQGEPVFRIDTPEADRKACNEWQRLCDALNKSTALTVIGDRGWNLIGSDVLQNRLQVKLVNAPQDADYGQLLDLLDGLVRALLDELEVTAMVVPCRHACYPQRASKEGKSSDDAQSAPVTTLNVIDGRELADAVA